MGYSASYSGYEQITMRLDGISFDDGTEIPFDGFSNESYGGGESGDLDAIIADIEHLFRRINANEFTHPTLLKIGWGLSKVKRVHDLRVFHNYLKEYRLV